MQLLLMIIVYLNLGSRAAAADRDGYYLCLHNCALCVRQWEAGVYDGEKCATKCMTSRSAPLLVDPDCKSLKMFDYQVMQRKTSERNARQS